MNATWTIRATRAILDAVRRDLSRPHPFAAERVCFVLCRLGNRGHQPLLLLPHEFLSLADEEYLRDDLVGARIGREAIRRAVTAAVRGDVCVLHTHMHEHKGTPSFSPMDLEDLPALVRALCAAGPSQPHGALVLSHDSASALVWQPGANRETSDGRIVVVGRPIEFHTGVECYG